MVNRRRAGAIVVGIALVAGGVRCAQAQRDEAGRVGPRQAASARAGGQGGAAMTFPDLPEGLTSFGFAVLDDRLYIYGGHTGPAHSYSRKEQSGRFWALDLKSPREWTALPGGPRLQGLVLVPYGKALLRVGGMTARNDEDEEEDLKSQDQMSRFDVKTGRWQDDLAPLPEPRSSHGAAVLGNRLYVVGGWALDGEQAPRWHKTAWSLDLAQDAPSWEPIPAPPFERRALMVVAHRGRLYVIGGIDRTKGPSNRVDVYDPDRKAWERGPDLEAAGMAGFGCAACSYGGHLYVSTADGNIRRLRDDGRSWEIVATVRPGRFFHAMVPVGDGRLLWVGGTSHPHGKPRTLKLIRLRR